MFKKRITIILSVIFAVLLIATAVSWVVTDNYLQNMDAKQTVAYARHFEIKNWLGEPIDENWAGIVQSGIQSYRRTGKVVIATGMDSREMSRAIEHSLRLIDGIFISAICVSFVGTVFFGVFAITKHIKNKRKEVV